MRRGQVAIFVIIGLAILLVAGIFLLRGGTNEPTSLAAQQESAKVTALVESCLAQVGEESLRRIGTQGGYADVRRFKETNDIRASQIVTVDPQKVVLWHEVHPCADSDSGCLGNNQPPLCRKDSACPVTRSIANPDLPSIEEELERSTAQEIRSCLAFTTIPQVLVSPQGEPEVDAIIREQDILLVLTYPLTITTSDNQLVDLDQYRARLDVNLPRIYRLADQTHQTEAQVSFIEEAFLHLLAIYSGADTAIPPMREVRIYGGSKVWIRHNVQSLIQNDILPFLNFLQLYNTAETFVPLLPPEATDPIYAPYATGAYQYLIVKLDNTTQPIGSRFQYPGTPIYLDINGKEILKPEKISGVGGILASLTGLNFIQYKFKYDVSFPMLVTLNDPAAFNGEGYDFTFGLEANIVNNYAMNASIRASQPRGIATLDVTDSNQLIDHTYRITATNRQTGVPIDGAVVSYQCGTRFELGITDDAGVWAGKLPYCFAGGAVLLTQQGYLADGKPLMNTEDDGAQSSLAFELWPRQERTILLYKRTSSDLLTGDRTRLADDDFAYLSIARQKENAYQDDVPFAGTLQFGKVGGSQTTVDARAQIEALHDADQITDEDYQAAIAAIERVGNTPTRPEGWIETQRMDLTPGTYTIEGMLAYTGVIVIPPKITDDYTLNGTNFTSWISGGIALTGPDAITLTPEQVYTDAPLVLYVLEQPLPTTWDDMQNYQQPDEYQAGKISFLQPTLS